MEEETKDKPKEQPKEEIEVLVVSELPKTEMSEGFIGEKKYNFVTAENALTEILKTMREIKGGLLGK